MRTFVFIAIFFTISLVSFGQHINYSISGVTNKRITPVGSFDFIDEGKQITLINASSNSVDKSFYQATVNGSTMKISISDIKKVTFGNPTNSSELWQNIRVKSDLDESLLLKGYQYDIRKDLEDETIDLLQNLERSYGFFNDEFIEDYIQGLLYKIHPIKLNDGRPGNLVIKVLKTSQPNAFCTPTGTIILTTGLLSTIRSEEELIGVLAHEVAHFVLDHQVVNINKANQRQKRAEFWAGFATAVAAASEAYVAWKYDVNLYGNLTLSTAIISSSIASSINERMGANYSIDQEREADNAAVMTLTLLHIDPKALSAALSRIYYYCTLNGDYYALSGSGTHPDLLSRINKIGRVDPIQFNSKKYDQYISTINTYNAINEFGLKHVETTMSLTSRNMESNLATEDDYILKAMSLRLLYDTPEKNQEALDLLNNAKTLNVTPNNYLFKQEGLTLIRLGRPNDAGEAFKNYLKTLETGGEKSVYVTDQIEWTKKMIFKISVL
jgi:beta-barrel assembly-enhancing protease